VIAPRSAQTQLGYEADGVWAVEGLLMARHHMHRQVYGHKTRVATDIMITRALKVGVEEELLPQAAYRVESEAGGDRPGPRITEEFIEAYLKQTDARVLNTLLDARSESAAHDLADRLTRRELLRQTASIRLDLRKHELGTAAYTDILDPDEFTRERIELLEAAIAEALDLPPHLVALSIDARNNPTYRQPGAPVGPKDVMVQRDDRPPQLLQTESEIFREFVGEDHSWAYLYTPRLEDERQEQAEELLWRTLRGD